MKTLSPTKPYIEKAKRFGYTALEKYDPLIHVYEPGEFVCQESKTVTHLLLVLQGNAKVLNSLENGKQLLCCFYEPGSFMGDIELLMEEFDAVSSVQAITTFICLAIPITQNKKTIYEDLKFMQQISKGVAGKFKRTTKNFTHIILYPLEVRLCSYIDTCVKDDLFSEKLTEVSEVLGTSYRHLLRSLNSLIEDGILQKEKQGYRIINRKELSARSKDYYRPVEGHQYYD